MKLFCFVVLFFILTGPAFAQRMSTDDPPRASSLREAIRDAGASAQTPATIRTRDSVMNGLVVGAVAGGVAAAVVGGVICNLLHEEGNPPCWHGTLAVGAVGAGIGAAAGAGIDALLSDTSRRPAAIRDIRLQRRAIAIAWRQRF